MTDLQSPAQRRAEELACVLAVNGGNVEAEVWDDGDGVVLVAQDSATRGERFQVVLAVDADGLESRVGGSGANIADDVPRLARVAL